MRKLTPFVIILILLTSLQAKDLKRSEILILNPDQSVLDKLLNLQIPYDITRDNKILIQVDANKLEKITEAGISYQMIKSDLEVFAQDFWRNRVPEGYHSYEEIVDLADSLALAYPDICLKEIFGTSVQGRELAALKISDNAEFDENEAEILLDGGIHGDEIGASQYLIRLAQELCQQYGEDDQITELINNREIWIYYMVNPDGRVNMTRANANNIDLNRNFGYLHYPQVSDSWCSEPEAKALRSIFDANQFSLNCSYHSGIEAIYYPWFVGNQEAPEFDHILSICTDYQANSGYPELNLFSPAGCIRGSSVDHIYGFNGTISILMELSHNKQPPIEDIDQYYDWNYPAMINIIRQSGLGIEGVVTDALTGEPIHAMISANQGVPFYSDPILGDFHRYFTNGTYDFTLKANNYQDTTITGIHIMPDQCATLDIQMQPQPGRYATKACATYINQTDQLDPNNLPYRALGNPDEIGYSFIFAEWIILDMGDPIIDYIGEDLTVYGIFDGAYVCSVSQSMDGPWFQLGEGCQKTSYDISSLENDQLRFVKIYHPAIEPSFSLDAVENVQTYPQFSVVSSYLDSDSGFLLPGSTENLVLSVLNDGNYVFPNIKAALLSENDSIAITNTIIEIDEWQNGETLDLSYQLSANPYLFLGTKINLTLKLLTVDDQLIWQQSIPLRTGKSPVLIITKSNGYESGFNFFTRLTNLGLNCDISSSTTVSITNSLNQFQSIFLFWGDHLSDYHLTEADEAALSQYLDNAGNIYLESEGFWYSEPNSDFRSRFNIQSSSSSQIAPYNINGVQNTEFQNTSLNYSNHNPVTDLIFPNNLSQTVLKCDYLDEPVWISNATDSYITVGSNIQSLFFQDYNTSVDSLYYHLLDYMGTIDYLKGSISGQVSCSNSQVDLSQTQITCKGRHFFPDVSGTFAFDIYEGNHNLHAQLPGYHPLLIEDVSVRAGITTSNQNFFFSQTSSEENIVTKVDLSILPNPFCLAKDGSGRCPETKISFSIIEESNVKVDVYNIRGQLVSPLLDSRLPSGQHLINWNGRNSNNQKLASGIYFICLEIDNKPTLVKKALLLK